MAGTTTNNIIELRDVRPVPDQPAPYSVALYGNAALIIDNGSYQCRAGWSTAARPALEFRNLIAKPRRDRNKKETAAEAAAAAANPPPIQVGNEIVNIEAMRFQLKSQFDRNVVTHSHNSEQIFDYVLRNLSVEGATDGGCPHAIVLTEPLANPNYSRQLMSELLFECYAVPKVAFGVDALFGFAHQQPTDAATATANNGDGLILSFGYHTTHVIPVLAGRPVHSRARRLNLGGAQMTNYLHRLLQLKYPVHTAAITLSRAEWLLHEHCSVAVDYGAALGRWRGLEHYEQHVKKVQLPFSMPAASATSALTAEQRVERRRETAKRLSDMNARRREEKLVEDELVLQRLVALRELWDDGDREEFEYACGQMEIAGHAELEKQIQQVLAKVHRTKAKISAANESGAAAAAAAAAQAADAAAAGAGDATGQPPLPAGGHPAVRVDAIVMVIPQPPDQLSIGDWVRQMRGRRSDILGRRAARRQRRLDLARRRTAAAQERMRVITQLARKEKGVDDFGARDEDWDVYKTIRRETGDSDSEVEQEKLQECEEVLRHHDPEFERTAGPGGAGAGGGGGAAGASGAGNAAMNPMLGAGNPAELYQLHVGVEAIRCTEILFQPSMVGCPEAGLAEIIEYVLRMFTADEQQAMVGNVFMTGGCASFPGLNERLTRELREIRPFETTFQLNRATDPRLDAWLGARQVVNEYGTEAESLYITRQEYAEKGGEYLREHRWGNAFYATPAPIADAAEVAVAANAV